MDQTLPPKASDTEETDGLPLPRRIWAVVAISFALCMSVLDINIVNIVLPTLSHDFDVSPSVITWIMNGYQLAIVISLLSFSSLGEIYGYQTCLSLLGIALFCITSLICALSTSFWTLTLARIFQGFSASAITSVNTAQLRTIYPRNQIGRGMGINAMVVAISAAAGPSIASAILAVSSWHWLFAINIPLGLTALILGHKYLPRKEERSKRKFDIKSAIANAVTFGLLIYTMDGICSSRANGLHCHSDSYIGYSRHLLRSSAIGTILSAFAAGFTKNTHFHFIHQYFHLFVYRTDAGNGFPAFFSAKHVGTQ